LKVDKISSGEVSKKIDIKDLRNSIAISPFSSRKTKDLIPEQIYDIIRTLNEMDIKPILLGSKEDLIKLSNFDVNKISYYNLVGKTDIYSFVYILSNTKGIISVDTSALYIASILGKSSVGIYGPTDPRTGFTPLPPTKSVFLELSCRPCSIHGSNDCKMKIRRCIEDINTKTITSALRELVDL